MGLNANGTSIFTLQFPDDQDLTAKSTHDLSNMMINIKEEYERC